MPPRKHVKRLPKTVVAKLELSGNADDSGHPTFPRTALSITSFPHIVTSITDHASPSALSALMRCSKYLHHLIAPKLYRHIHLKSGHLLRTLKAGLEPTAAGMPCPSPYLTECLLHTRSIHFGGYRPSSQEQSYSFDKLAAPQLSTIVIHPTNHWRPKVLLGDWLMAGRELDGMELQGEQQALPAPHLYIRLSESFVAFWRRTSFEMTDLPEHVQSVTLIVPAAWRLEDFPSCFPAWAGDALGEKSLTIVLLPGLPRPAERTTWLLRQFYHAALQSECYPDTLALRIVGIEYTAYKPRTYGRILSRCPRPTKGSMGFMRWSDWINELEPGTVFTAEEEAKLRADDLMIWAQRAQA